MNKPPPNWRPHSRCLERGGRYIRSGRQQMIKFRNLIRFALRVGDDDLPAFARPDSSLGDDDKSTGSFDFYCLVVAFCDHLVSQLGTSHASMMHRTMPVGFDRNSLRT